MQKIIVGLLIAATVLTGCAATATQTEPAPTQAKLLSKEEAVGLALEHAGLTADQITGLRAEFDPDDGRREWDVDFYSGGYEYDYTIHAETGKILDVDKDRDD